MPATTTLKILSEKTLHNAADPSLVAYCPSMDLIALVTKDQQVLIYRINGQRVYGSAQKGDNLRVGSLRWKPNGKLFAIAWNDGTVRIIGTESCKVVHQFSVGSEVTGVTCVGWCSNLTKKTSSSVHPSKFTKPWQLLPGNEEHFKESLDLPRDLSLIDIETSLPKLSVLTFGGSSDDVFSSKASLDPLFRPFDPQDTTSVNVLVVGTREGQIHISIYDSFVIGSFPSPIESGNDPASLALHASNENHSTHSLLLKQAAASSLHFVPMDLRFISASSEHLSLLASRSTALENLLRYIHQTHTSMVAEWKSTQDLPSRFLRNINETLEEKGVGDITQCLYHAVATGHTYPAVRDWLVDELAERGHKRWDKAVVTGLENLKRLVHENMLPALDRCSVILSRFAGITKFQSSHNGVGFSIAQINKLTDTVACLQLVATKVLLQVVDESDLFHAFSAWLRHEIDRLASEDSASPNDEAMEKESSIDHSKVLLYLQTAMNNSPLEVYLGDSSAEDDPGNMRGSPLYDLLNKEIQKQERGLKYNKSIPRLEGLCKILAQRADAIFRQIAESEKRNVLFGKGVHIGATNSKIMDMRMETLEKDTCHTFIAYIPKDFPSSIRFVRIALSIEKGISSVDGAEAATLQLGDGTIKDFKFFSSKVLLVLWRSTSPGSVQLLRIPFEKYTPDGGLHREEYHMEYAPYDSFSGHHIPTKIDADDVPRLFQRFTLPSNDSFEPVGICVRDSSDTNNIPDEGQRIILLGSDGNHYKIFQPSGLDREPDGDVQMSQ